MNDLQILEIINRRQRQIIIHSCIYYNLGDSIVSDVTFDKWAKQLVGLMQKFPHIAKESENYHYFIDFDGSTGYDLPIHSESTLSHAEYILRISKQFNKS